MENNTEVEQHQIKNVLKIEPPSELVFTGPFDRPVISKLTLINQTNHSVCYKVQTNARVHYLLRNSFGVIGPNRSQIVEVHLKPFVYESNEEMEDKFKILSIMEPKGPYDFQELFNNATGDQIMQTKIVCVFKMPVGIQASGVAGVGIEADDEKEVAPTAVVANVSDEEAANSPPESLPKEIHELQEEVRELKEETLLFKKQLMEQPVNESEPPVNELQAPLAETEIQTLYIVLAVLAVLAGLFVVFLGKYLL